MAAEKKEYKWMKDIAMILDLDCDGAKTNTCPSDSRRLLARAQLASSVTNGNIE